MRPKSIKILFFFCLTLTSCAQSKKASDSDLSINYEVVVPGIDIPWGFTFLPDNSMLITEKTGQLFHFKDNSLKEINGLPKIYVRGQGGLMDIIIHPDYKTNGWIYMSYASSQGEGEGGNTTIMRAKLEDNRLINQDVLYKANPNSRRGQHFGCRLAFDNDDYLYFSIGDRGNRDVNPQDITRDCGKIYRLNDDGTIPEDNPFINTPNAKKAIYSYGHRNPQGMTLHPETYKIWTHEHGPKGGDEINIIEAGKNYGWPVISYGVNYSGSKFTDLTERDGMEQPIHYWTPSIAPSGMAFISSDKYGDWKGNLLVGSLKFQYISNCKIKDDTIISETKLLEGSGRIRSINQGPDGYIYVGIEGLGIVKLLRND
ncbi:PQQ-dependent sugar dehydrogenase [Ichthyenterobacterium sp. W332]|uniref:PQQ-dependent sugar dehydrogenase n=1 Tax=Microcosmobacter mediterraneus TaxID=3075607 RepID=A0ABU2YGF8_9FLAO|nr:PQQ-dependent sugar dehydrogenase [Ichthyenterobacterium sp. W332]MDT0557236.1 PQQ-dependent sugar dehydrogenase [Ichthyenterobacterium sp. W332]